MSEMGELFNDLRKHRQEKRAANRINSSDLLRQAGISFDTKNGGAHLIVQADGHIVDFWPGTGKWVTRGYRFTLSGRGVHNLIKHLKGLKP